MAADLAAALACIEPFGFDLHSALDFAPDADGAAPGSSAAAPPEPLPLAASAFVCIEPFGFDLHLSDGAPPQPVPSRSPPP